MNPRPKFPILLALTLAGVIAACNKGKSKTGPATPTGEPFALTVEAPPSGAAGGDFAATVKVEPKGIYKVNLEYPTRLEVKGPAGAAPREVKLTSKQAAKLSEKVILFKPSFKLAAAGEHTFAGTLRFSVCTPKQCELKNEKVKWVTKVTE
jgi:hypothetical protein